MELEHSFTVPVGIDKTWEVLNDIERVVPCMPGATLTGHDGDDFTGTVKVKVGPMQVTYEGSATFVERDEEARRTVLEAKGDQQRGAGTAHATITATMTDDGGDTTVTVTTDLQITGRPAQFGRGVLNDVGDKLLGQFAECLAEEVVGPDVEDEESRESETGGEAEAANAAGGAGTTSAAPARTAPRRTARPQRDEAIDLLDVAGPSVAKRVVPALVALAVLYLLWRLFSGDHDE